MQPPRFIAYILRLPRLIGFILALATMGLGILMLGTGYATPLDSPLSNTTVFLLGFIVGVVGALWMLYVLGVR